MAARFGRILYWAACGIAAMSAALGAFIAIDGNEQKYFGMTVTFGFAAIVWLAGRAARYVLAGE